MQLWYSVHCFSSVHLHSSVNVLKSPHYFRHCEQVFHFQHFLKALVEKLRRFKSHGYQQGNFSTCDSCWQTPEEMEDYFDCREIWHFILCGKFNLSTCDWHSYTPEEVLGWLLFKASIKFYLCGKFNFSAVTMTSKHPEKYSQFSKHPL